MTKKIIGISGKKSSGKDTACDVIINTLADAKIERIAFADALKEEVACLLGITVEEINADKARYRGILQWWGTEWRRRQNENYWVDQLASRVNHSPADVIIITDVRFLNELLWVESMDGITLRIVRDSTAPDQHPSEIALDKDEFDYAIDNFGTLDQFQSGVARMAKEVLTQKLGLAIREEA